MLARPGHATHRITPPPPRHCARQWTSWVLLVILALYDLCAVLTPCGPLRALIALAQVRRDPIPGLLYEANVGPERDSGQVRDTFVTRNGAVGQPAGRAPGGPNGSGGVAAPPRAEKRPASSTSTAAAGGSFVPPAVPVSGGGGGGGYTTAELPPPRTAGGVSRGGAAMQRVHVQPGAGSVAEGGDDIGVAGALTPPARMPSAAHTALPGGQADGGASARRAATLSPTSLAAAAPSSRGGPSDSLPAPSRHGGASAGPPSPPPASIMSETTIAAATVAATGHLPPSDHHHGHGHSHRGDGGRAGAVTVADLPASSPDPVGAGKPAHRPAARPVAPGGGDVEAGGGSGDEGEGEEEEEDKDRSISLGLGDLVFYSVLVSRAALFDVSTMAACFIAVIVGLAGTLTLLGIFRKALPALPISIFLGVLFYFLTRLVITPFVVEMSLNAVAV